MDAFSMAAGGGGAPPPEEDFSKLSIEDRLNSKVWKARVSGYESLVKAFEKSPDESDPIFRPYTRNADAVKAIATDSNAVAQEKGLDVIKAFLQYGGKAAGQTREVVMPALVDKCFGAARAGTKKAALDVVELYAEAEDIMGCEGLVSEVLRGTTAKQPKIVAGAVLALTNLVRDFGPKQINFKPILKKLPDIFGHADKGVRQEASSLAQEIHKWIGAALEPTLAALKEIQARELREQFAANDAAGQKNISPVRFLLSQQPRAPAASSGNDDMPSNSAPPEVDAGSAEDADLNEFLEPVDPLRSKLWPTNFDEMMRSAKWLERKEALDQCVKVLEAAPKMLYTPPVDGIVDILAEKVKKDANINVCLAACQCIAKFALGLRGDFARNKDKVLPPLLEKLKERKDTTVKALSDTLDAVFQSVTLSDILEHTLAATKHKNPAVKTGAIQFLARCLKETRQMPAKGDIKPIADALVVAMADGSADVRDAGAQGLGTLMKLIGERPMNQYLDTLDDIKKSKVHEQFVNATVKVKASGPSTSLNKSRGDLASTASAPATRPQANAVAASAPKPKPTFAPPPLPFEKENAPPAAAEIRKAPAAPALASAHGPPSRLMSRQPATLSAPSATSARAPTAAGGAAKKSVTAVSGPAATEPVKFRYSQEDADARATELVPTAIVEDLSNSVWKERLAGMTKFNDWLKIEATTIDAEIIARFLAKRPGWKESNFQVMAEVYSALRLLAENSGSFGRSTVALSIAPLCEKLGDIKLKTPAGDTLTLFAEKTSLGFVLTQALGPLGSLKAPKSIADSLLWVNQAILEFGTAGVDIRGVVDHLLVCLKSANASVRTNATLVIGTLARFLGAALTTFLSDLNPQLRSTVEAAIEKAVQEPTPVPSRVSDERKAKQVLGVVSSEGISAAAIASSRVAEEDPLDALIPRVDLDKIVPASIPKKLNDANWKERKEGMEELIGILEANTRLQSNFGELGNALKARYGDSNMQVKTMALEALCMIAKGMNKGFEQHARIFVAPVSQVLSDSKAPIRSSASKTLTAIAEQIGVAPMIPGFVSVLESKAANPMLRQDLLTWLGEWFEVNPPEKGLDLNGLALPTIASLDDKLAAVRKAAQTVLPFVIARAGYKFVIEQTNSLKSASRSSVIPLIDAARAQAARNTPAEAAKTTSSAIVSAKVQNGTHKPAHVQSHPSNVLAPPARVAKSTTIAARPLNSLSTARAGQDGVRTSKSATQRSFTAMETVAPSTSGSGRERAQSPPFSNSDPKGKALRERREPARTTSYWIGPEAVPRPELVDILRQQSETSLSDALLDKMFSKDHNAERDFLSGLTLLADYMANTGAAADEYGLSEEEVAARATANSDLIFKYIAIRLTDNNTSIAMKCLDVLATLITLLRAQEYHMSDYEANAILPCIIAKFGDPKVTFRDQIRTEILRKITYVYPPSKLFTRLQEDGLSNRNVRVRTESLGEIGHLFQRYGMQVCTLSKALPVVAKQISDRDNGVRTAALLAVGEVYKVEGKEVWKLVGKLPAKEMSLLEERLKRTVGPASAQTPLTSVVTTAKSHSSSSPQRQSRTATIPAGALSTASSAARTMPSRTPGPTGAASGRSRIAVPTRIGRPAGGSGIPLPSSLPRTSRLPTPSEDPKLGQRALHVVSSQPAVELQDSPAPQSETRARTASRISESSLGGGYRRVPVPEAAPVSAEEDAAIDSAIAEILSSESDTSVGALKRIEADIQQIAPGLAKHADSLALAFAKQLRRAFGVEDDALNNQRLKKHLLITGTSIFDNTRLWEDISGTQRTLGSFIGKSALILMLTELLQQLVETKGAMDEEIKTHGRYLNIIVLRSFSSCGLNVLFGACLSMLAEATEDFEEIKAHDEGIFEKRVKFADLICKCLWKITRKLNASLSDELVDPVELLHDLERFLQAIPPGVWKERASKEMPLGDMPLRTVKVIITHIGSVYGESSLDLLDGFSQPEQTHVYVHLLNVCDRAQGSLSGEAVDEELARETEVMAPLAQGAASEQRREALTPPGDEAAKVANTASEEHAASTLGSADVRDDEEAVNSELRGIFDRIASKSESRAAIKDLYLFQRKYPHKDPSIRRSLQQTGPIFQKFIRRALANHAAEDGEPLPLLEEDEAATQSPHRDSMYSSPGALSPARISTRRESYLSPSPSRNALLPASGSFSTTPGTPGTPYRNGALGQEGSGNLQVRSHDDDYYNVRGASPTSPPSASAASLATMPRARPGVASENGVVNEGRLAQLRAKFARPVS